MLPLFKTIFFVTCQWLNIWLFSYHFGLLSVSQKWLLCQPTLFTKKSNQYRKYIWSLTNILPFQQAPLCNVQLDLLIFEACPPPHWWQWQLLKLKKRKKGLITSQVSKKVFSVSKWAFIFKMCFHFQSVKGLASVFETAKEKKNINYFSLFPEHVFIFKLVFEMSFHFPSIVLFQNLLSFSKCARFCERFFFLFPKNTIVHKNLCIHYKYK